MKSRYWAELSSADFAALDKSRTIAILPVGAIEQHGPHLPVGVDTRLLDDIIGRALTTLSDELPVLALPTVAVGKSNEHLRYPGTLSFSAETLMRVWRELGAGVATAGLKKLLLFNSHGGQIAAMDIVARDLRIDHDLLVVSSSWFAHGTPDGVCDDHELAHGIHGGTVETSMMLASAPGVVAMDKAQRFESLTERLAADGFIKIGLNTPGKLAWQTQDLNPLGACGDASDADADKGERLLDHAAGELVKLLEEFDRLSPSLLDNMPEIL